jgi:hypothetical protein
MRVNGLDEKRAPGGCRGSEFALLYVANRPLRGKTPPPRQAALMRINIWIILAALLALLVITRYLQEDRDTQRICADDPSASVCQR